MEAEHVLVLGPAGSGKTAFLRRRFVELLRQGADPDGILLLVANRQAARAAQEAILREVGSVASARCSTWHAFALGLLHDHYRSLGYTRAPSLVTAPEQLAVVRDLLADPDERARWGDLAPLTGLRGFAEELRELVLRAQDQMWEPEALGERARAAGRPEIEEAARFFRRYLSSIDAQNVVDHANSLARTVTLLREDPSVPRPEHVLVDDYQDVSLAQEALLAEMAASGASITVAGDPAGHVFAFRGTSPEPLARFERAFVPVSAVRLETIHRGRPGAQAWVFGHLSEEAEAVARECLRLNAREGVPWREIAVIVRRYGAISRAVRRALARAGVPHVVVGENRSLATEPALRPMLDLARAALRPESREDLLPGLLASPAVGLDPYEVRALRREARLRGTTLSGLLATPPEGLAHPLSDALLRLRDLIAEVAERERTAGPDDVFWLLWERLGYFGDLVGAGDDESLDGVVAFARAIAKFSERREGKRFGDYLEVLEAAEFGPEPWTPPEDRRPDAVRVLTAHHSAGLEFEAVVIAGCVEGEFPMRRRGPSILDLDTVAAPLGRPERAPLGRAERAAAALEEERRLLGVAASRARRHLLLTACRETAEGEPSDPSPLVHSLGVAWGEAPGPGEPITRGEIEAAARRALADRSAAGARLAGLEILARLPGVDPGSWWYERDWTDPGTPLAPEPLRTSYSRLSSYENCPLQYLYAVELGLDPQQTHQMLVGVWVHEIIDRCARGEVASSDEALLADLDACWDPGIFPSPAIEHRRRLDAEEMLRRWLRSDAALPTLASEVSFSFPLDGATMRGKIDRVVRIGNESVRLIDYKTGRNAKSQDEVEADLQLASYFLALRRDPELARLGEPRYLELAYLGAFYQSGFVRRGIDVSRRPDFEKEAEARLNGFVAGIRAEEFRPSPGADCRWCAFKMLCPVWPEGDEVRT